VESFDAIVEHAAELERLTGRVTFLPIDTGRAIVVDAGTVGARVEPDESAIDAAAIRAIVRRAPRLRRFRGLGRREIGRRVIARRTPDLRWLNFDRRPVSTSTRVVATTVPAATIEASAPTSSLPAPLASLVRVSDDVAPLIARLLGRTYAVDSIAEARRVAER